MDSNQPGTALFYARDKKRKAHLALGIILMASITVASAQSLVREELGDASVGLAAGISVLGATQPVTPPQGKLLIAPLKKNPSLNRELSLDLLASEKGDPPRRYFKRYEIAVDRQLHQTTQVHPWMLPYYTIALPYAPKTVGVTGFLSTGESFSTTVEVPTSLPLDRTLDIRTNEITQHSDRYDGENNEARPASRLDTPYRDQIVYWLGNASGGGASLKIQAACLGFKAAGRIVYTRLTIKKHYYYSPDGDMTLMETTFHQPMYGTDEGVDFAMPRYPVFNPDGVRSLRSRQPDDRSDDPNNPYPARFVFECRTETGKVMQREFEYRYRARRFSSPGQ